MLHIFKRFKGNKKLLWGAVAALAALLILGIALANRGNGNGETYTVTRQNVVEIVRVSGTVEADIVSDLGFEAGGVIRDVHVDVNDKVARGQALASLGLGTLPAELQSARAALALKRAETSNTGVTLDAVTEKHNTLVRNAQIELYSDGLVAEPHSVAYTQTAPIVSGRYTGGEGTYKFTLRQGTQTSETDLYIFGMEDAPPVEVSDTGATPLGENGLFLTFPDGPEAYEDTTWYVTIPNTKSSSYAANYSAYQDAERERDRAVEEAQNDLRSQSEGVSVAEAELLQAEAEVARIEALIGERILRAPFSGTVTAVDIDPGESVTAGTMAISMISEGELGVEVDLPEIDSIKVRNGAPATITLDAFTDTPLGGTVVSVNRTETIVDGVSVYEARLAFDEQDDRVISGMTADVAITTGERENALAIPARALRYDESGAPYVLVKDPATEDVRKAVVTTGLRGSDGAVEITAGLSEGDIVLIAEAVR